MMDVDTGDLRQNQTILGLKYPATTAEINTENVSKSDYFRIEIK